MCTKLATLAPVPRLKAKDGGGEEDQDALLEDKRSMQDFCYQVLDTLPREKAFTMDWRVK